MGDDNDCLHKRIRPNCKKVGQNSCNVLGDSKIRVFVIYLSLFNY